ncbi:glycosyltransferase family 39 protein [Rossellomorea vietnamensis]|uniref:Uncharacterized protein n=1 Tax=Rossellomorea vietnamensis TaxID=218284 RepID=A0A0P6WFM5_9BACI|nr:glycosyltransferase family 39 protein [Rossellomorea vietnamensis]KPL59273.1 hypothetical protein AM506_12175 [Rossellomorea vietnamensis]
MGAQFVQFLHRFIYILFFSLILFLVGLNVFMSRGYSTISQETPHYFNIITLFLAIIISLILFLCRNHITRFIEKLPTFATVFTLLGVSVVLQTVVIRELSVTPSWDFGAVVNSAKLFVESGEMSEYFSLYPNNILLACILALIGNIFTPELLTFQVFNVIVITLSQYLIYRIATKVAGAPVGIVSLLVSVLFFPYIFFAPIVYTDTISLIFLLLPLHILVDKNGDFRGNIFIVSMASILFSFGMLLKGSLVIFVIAIAIVLFLYQKKWRKLYFIIPLLVLLIVKSLFNSAIYHYGILDKAMVEEKSMPVTHWIVMGQNKNKLGKYAEDDVVWTKELLTKYPRETVSQIHYQELKNRISEKGIKGNIAFNIEKIGHTWTDGTYYSLNKLRRIPDHPEHFTHLTTDTPGHLIQGHARVQHLMLLIGLLLFLRLKNKDSFTTFSMLSVIGFFLFFIIWETRSRYLVSLTPLMIIVSCMGYLKGLGIETLLYKKSKIK